jgi:four helix bundle protein
VACGQREAEEGEMAVKGYEELLIWQKGIELATETYRLSRKFPASERLGLTRQLQRVAISVSSNIAEGQSRRGRGESRRFLYQALGSLAEVDTQLVPARELGYMDARDAATAVVAVRELRRMTHGLVNRLPAIRRPQHRLTSGHRPPATGH